MGIKLSDEILNDIQNSYKNGISIKELALKHNMHEGSVRRLLRKGGQVKKKTIKGELSKEDIQNIIKRYNDGENIMDIAKTTNFSDSSISRLLDKNRSYKKKFI